MKRILINSVLCAVSAVFMFGCSTNPADEPTPVKEQPAEQISEEQAWADLLAESEKLRAEYCDGAETRIVSGYDRKWNPDVAQFAPLGGLAVGPNGGLNFNISLGAVVSSYFTVRDRISTGRRFSEFRFLSADFHNSKLNTYLTLGTRDDFDAYGLMYNKAIINMVDKLGISAMETMTDDQAYSEILLAVRKANNNFLPPMYDPYMTRMNMLSVRNITNNLTPWYIAGQIGNQNPQYNKGKIEVMQSYLKALSELNEADRLDFHVSYRYMIETSNLSVDSKCDLRALISIGLASSYLWVYLTSASVY